MIGLLTYAAVFAAGWVTGRSLWPAVWAWIVLKLGPWSS